MKKTRVITPKKKAFFGISAVLFSGILMLGLNFILPTVAVFPLIALTEGNLADNEIVFMLFEIVVYLAVLFLTGGFLLIVFRKSPIDAFRGTLSTPKFPFLFIPATLGLSYAINMAVGIVFEEQLVPFEPAVDELSFAGTPIGVGLYCIMICILPAVFEEWLFRGIMLKNLAPIAGNASAVLISALVFGLMHTNPAQSVFAVVFGIVAGYAYVKTGSIWFGALIHMLNNAVSFVSTYWYYVYQSELVMIFLSLFTLLMIGVFVVAIPVYIVSAVHRKRKLARMSEEQRLRPTGGAVLKMTLCNPLLYVLFAGYCVMLWVLYFVEF